MNNRVAKILRAGAKHYRLPYKHLKKAYQLLNRQAREQFLAEAEGVKYHV